MNLFVTHPCPTRCAQALDDKRVIKMTLETAQLLSTTVHCLNLPWADDVYRQTHKNHPCALWTRETQQNYAWALLHFQALAAEYAFRFTGKSHKSLSLLPLFEQSTAFVPQGDQTLFADCSNMEGPATTLEEITQKYKACLKRKWAGDTYPPKWTARGAPDWA